jgi:amidase
MRVTEYTQHDATALAQLLREGEVSREEVHIAAVAAIEAVEPHVNAMADGPWAKPLEHAGDGAWAGVPFALKDLGPHPAGVPMRGGSRLSGTGVVHADDSFLMRRFRALGLATFGLTTSPELGFNASTETVLYGATRNPWDLSRSAGGSSGGSGAIVAAGGVPVASGGDGGGSIRIPASCNGLVGLRPSRGRTSNAPDFQEVAFGLGIDFALTRTLRDCAALLDAVAAPAPGDKYLVAPPARPWAREVSADPGRLRIAIHTTSWSDVPVDPEVAEAVEAVGRTLEGLGHYIEPATPRVEWDAFLAAQTRLFATWNAAGVEQLAALTGNRPGPDTLEATMLVSHALGRRLTALELMEALRVAEGVMRTFGAFFTDWDLLLTPMLNVPPLPLGYLNGDDPELDAEGWTRRLFGPVSFGPLINWAGTPAISLPLGWSADGLPLGVQLAAPMCDEATLFRVGGQLEQAMPWAERRPPLHAAALAPHEA